MLDKRGRSSPSFLIAVALAVLVVGSYAAWRISHPSPHKQSERIVREFVSAGRRKIRELRRAMVRLSAEQPKRAASVAPAIEAIESRLHEATENLDELAEDARARVEDLEDLGIRTLRNRIDRIDRRLTEFQKSAQEVAAEAKATAGGGGGASDPPEP